MASCVVQASPGHERASGGSFARCCPQNEHCLRQAPIWSDFKSGHNYGPTSSQAIWGAALSSVRFGGSPGQHLLELRPMLCAARAAANARRPALNAPGAVCARGPQRPGRMGSYNGLATTPWGCGRKIRHPSNPVRQLPGRWHRAARVPAHLRQCERPRARALRLLDPGIFRVVSPPGSAVRARGQLRDLGSGSKPSRSRTGDWRKHARDV